MTRAIWLAALLLGSAAQVLCDDPPKPPANSDWPLESLTLNDGTVYRGLLQAEQDGEIEFVEIHRPEGKPMFAVVRPVAVADVARRERLPDAERAKLIARFAEFRHRARIEAGRLEQVELHRENTDLGSVWQYRGHWFDFESTADESMTRRCVVRVEQLFRAFRQILPPRVDSPRRLKIILLGSLAEYRDHLQRHKLEIDNPAYFSTEQNTMVAASDLNAFAERLATVREHHARLRQQYATQDADFAKRMASLIRDLKAAGFAEAEIESEVKLRRTNWQRQRDRGLADLDRRDRENESRFNELTAAMFRRLNHEAFHAYLENSLYPRDAVTFPRWLNEGLAQIFETAQLDGDTLRIDAPDRDKLRQLQADLAGESPLPLADVLSAGEAAFFVSHGREGSPRHYLYSWGLTYFLIFESGWLRSPALDEFARNQEKFGPTARFVAFTQTPLGKFETQWRDHIARLQPAVAGQTGR